LVIARPDGRTFRYRLLDTTRAYGQEKLEESGEANPQRLSRVERAITWLKDQPTRIAA
jgi:predicted ATPase